MIFSKQMKLFCWNGLMGIYLPFPFPHGIWVYIQSRPFEDLLAEFQSSGIHDWLIILAKKKKKDSENTFTDLLWRKTP